MEEEGCYTCPKCRGAGYFIVEKGDSANAHALDRQKLRTVLCKACKGTGTVDEIH